MKTDKNESQGKQSEAKTDATYDRNAEALKKSATTSQNSGTSPSPTGAGGVMSEEDGNTGKGATGSQDQGS